MTDEARRAAMGLSRGEQAAVRGRILHIAKRDSLVAKGVLTPRGGRNWTPLGLAVKAILQQQEQP